MRTKLIAALCLALFVTVPTWASSRPVHPAKATARTAVTTKVVTGKVVSSSATELVLSRSVKGKASEERFSIGPKTVTTGELKPGVMASVQYQVNGEQKEATSVRVKAHKAQASAPVKK